MVVAEIVGSMGGLKTVMDTLKGLKDIGDANIRNAVAVELQEKILTAYQAQMALTEHVSDLEKEVANLKSWDAEKQKYELKDVGQGCVAYLLKEGVQSTEAAHKLCANCYTKGKKSFLQPEKKHMGRGQTLNCHECGSELYIFGHFYPDETRGKR
jgi:hypothetical protein